MIAMTARATAACAAGALLAACTAMSPAPDPPALEGTAWVLSALAGQSLLPDARPTARFEGARVQGTDGCNRFTAPYTASVSTLQIGPRGASTQMACPPAVMKQAEAFMSALTRASSYRMSASELQLLAADGTTVATFAAQPQSLAGTAWRVTNFNNGRQAVVGVLAGTNLTVSFSNDGRVGGSAGCNRFGGPYTADGSKVTVGPLAVTRRICASPEGVMEQERQFLKALEAETTARFEGDRLELRTADGALAAILTREAGR